MAFMHIHRSTTIEVPDRQSLRAAWKTYGGPLCLVASFIVDKPLTASQLRRLPTGLRDRLESLDDSVDFLERLYALPDPRL